MKKNKEIGKIKKPWPTKEAMEQVYAMKLWGENEENQSTFYSGMGSHHPEIIGPYIAALTSFLTSFKKPIDVCDLGCGDFNVGKELVKYTKKYTAVDIVPELIAYNKSIFKANNLEFSCLDISNDELPLRDCALVRQVLQHLSNTEVLSIVNKLSSFRYVIITEHVPEGAYIPNRDIISGQGTRLKKKSGLLLSAPPFNFKAKKEKNLLSINLKHNQGVINTRLFEFPYSNRPSKIYFLL